VDGRTVPAQLWGRPEEIAGATDWDVPLSGLWRHGSGGNGTPVVLQKMFGTKTSGVRSCMNTDDEGREMPDSMITVANTSCPDCGSTEFEMRNYSMMWHEGDIHCKNCGRFIRTFDAG